MTDGRGSRIGDPSDYGVGIDSPVRRPEFTDAPSGLAPHSPLTKAHGLVHGARNSEYSHPYDDFTRIAAIWSAQLGINVTPRKVAQLMIGLKLSRLSHNETHEDSWVDIAGYVECEHMISEHENESTDPWAGLPGSWPA